MSLHESTPLLPSSTETSKNLSGNGSLRRDRQHASWVYIVAHCIAIAITADIAEYLSLAPQVRLFESIICTDYYRHASPSLITQDGSIPEHLCKIDPVQDSVASIIGWQLFFEAIPAILLPIPYGYLADTYGRKWIAVLAILSYTLSWAFILFIVGVLHLPLQYVWLAPVFFLIGGGPPMATTLLTTMVADVSPADKRSSAFFYRFTSELIAECFVPPITAILMARSPWIPLTIGLALLVLCTIMTLALPETLPIQQVKGSDPARANESLNTDEEQFLSVSSKSMTWKDQVYQIKQSFSFATHTTTLAALIFTFLISKIGRQSIDLLLQYVSKRYGWSLSKAGLLLSLRAAVNILLFTLILPYIATFAVRKSGSAPEITPTSRNLTIARGSMILMVIGTLTLSVSFTPGLMILGLILYTLGTGSPLVIRSLTTTLVEKSHAEASQQHLSPPLLQPSHNADSTPDQVSSSPSSEIAPIGRLYALLQIMEGIGNLIAGPGMAWLFRVGIRLGNGWLGLPFMAASLLFGIVGGVVFWVRVRE